METFIYAVIGLYIVAISGIIAWVVNKNAESDAKYERDLDEIYGRKR